MDRSSGWLQDASGSVGDLGVLAPIVAALVIGNGLDPATVLCGVGALYLLAGWYFKVPVPVQPIKAAAAIAIARKLPPETLAAAGVVLGACLMVLAATGASRWIAKAFSVPIIRGLQLGVGLILVKTAITLASPDAAGIPLMVAIAVAVILTVAARRTQPLPMALILVVGAVIYSLISTGAVPDMEFALWHPHLNHGALDLATLGSAFVLLVIPQIPLTFGNAVVAVVDLEHRYFPVESRKVNPRSISFSCGLANITAGMLTGMPMCHGSGGLTAHYRAGARTYRMNLIIGVVLLGLGLFFGPTALTLIALVPVPVLAGFLAFTGLFHSSLAASLRGTDLAIAITIGVLGLLTTNLAIALAAGLVLYWPLALLGGGRDLEPAPS
ncbi:MAG: hypothetical protein QOG04_1560 [Actinomycetota bacterium]|jgi:hypothetical protein|nr:hypothetical protein [Actinomycetota bacterium]